MACQHGAKMWGGGNSDIEVALQPVSYTNMVTYTNDDTQPDYYEDYLFGIVPDVRHRPDVNLPSDTVAENFVAGVTNTYHHLFLTVGDFTDADPYIDAPLTLLDTVSCTNATEVPYFTIEAAYTNIQLQLSDYQQHAVDYWYSSERHTDDIIKFETEIAITKFVVVVDWAWPFAGVAYTNDTYTPEWVTTNTP